jgi:hypothetical protein
MQATAAIAKYLFIVISLNPVQLAIADSTRSRKNKQYGQNGSTRLRLNRSGDSVELTDPSLQQ